MRLRNLELKDAPLMLEWMHDESVVGKLKGNFIEKTLADAESFILASANKKENIHLAIVSDEDEYMGTVSLKHGDGERLFLVWDGRNHQVGIRGIWIR